ncbi:Predicted oxidoreductase [Actinacidiphila yanglinensis]|uniref:Predicted oxidoreductase n=1 Tax=Actinacidiphila yanglinensis TaxID=310779 RepID=A0A1H6E761_9ACTN|nr:aldo/keto reductase family protein [Actinacidiphila yanglinensis]SEG93542.1 Predicted oxidoreductase [Actinacidiphila yanglinensis]
MKYAQVGESGLVVSRIIYGNAITHGDQIDESLARDCVRAALDSGITTFDTADLYAEGEAEEILGRALAGVRREQLVLCSKVGRWMRKDDPNAGRLSRKHIAESIDASLRRLGTDHVDLYQAHRYDPQTPVEETVAAFADIVKAGKAHYIGVSEWPADVIREAARIARDLSVPFVANQSQYSLLWRVIETAVLPTSQECGVGQIVWMPLAGGVLTGKYKPGAALPEGSRAGSGPMGAKSIGRWDYLNEKVLTAVAELGPLAAEAGLTPAQLAIAWVLATPGVSATVMGASRPAQLLENVAAVDVELDAELLRRVEAAVAPVVRADVSLTVDPLGPAARL